MSAELVNNGLVRFFTDRLHAVSFANCKSTIYSTDDLPANIHNRFPILLMISGAILGILPIRYRDSNVITWAWGTDLATEPNKN
jgi:hypothetical protein